MESLALPGDEQIVLALLIREAMHRDDRPTRAERLACYYARECVESRGHWGDNWRCSHYLPCHLCQWVSTLL